MNRLEESKLEGKVRSILTRYGGEIAADAVFFRGIRGGFSGSRVFEVISKLGTCFFLKQWPAIGPDLGRLRFIHDVLTQLDRLRSAKVASNLPQFAVPLKNAQGDSVTVDGETLWDLTPKLVGSPIEPAAITSNNIQSAMQSLARVHLALDQLGPRWVKEFPDIGGIGHSPGLSKRYKRLSKVFENSREIAVAIENAPLSENLRLKCKSLLAAARPLASKLANDAGWEGLRLPLQPVLRDIWYAHVLFDQSQVSGIIDFGSIGVDSVATDLARLLRSWIPGDDANFREALDAYHQIHPLSAVERDGFVQFDRTSRVLSAFQWIEWLAIERREFDDWEAVAARLDFVLSEVARARRDFPHCLKLKQKPKIRIGAVTPIATSHPNGRK